MPDTIPKTAPDAAEQALVQADAAESERVAGAGQRIEAAVAAWVQTSLAGGAIARATECWNQLQSALPALKAAMLKEMN